MIKKRRHVIGQSNRGQRRIEPGKQRPDSACGGAGLDFSEEVLEAVQSGWLILRWVEHCAQISDGVWDGSHRLGQRCPTCVGVSAALEFLSNFQRVTVAAAEAHDHGSIGPPKECEKDGKTCGLAFKQLM